MNANTFAIRAADDPLGLALGALGVAIAVNEPTTTAATAAAATPESEDQRRCSRDNVRENFHAARRYLRWRELAICKVAEVWLTLATSSWPETESFDSDAAGEGASRGVLGIRFLLIRLLAARHKHDLARYLAQPLLQRMEHAQGLQV